MAQGLVSHQRRSLDLSGLGSSRPVKQRTAQLPRAFKAYPSWGVTCPSPPEPLASQRCWGPAPAHYHLVTLCAHSARLPAVCPDLLALTPFSCTFAFAQTPVHAGSHLPNALHSATPAGTRASHARVPPSTRPL
jgi:hypothetical protein